MLYTAPLQRLAGGYCVLPVRIFNFQRSILTAFSNQDAALTQKDEFSLLISGWIAY